MESTEGVKLLTEGGHQVASLSSSSWLGRAWTNLTSSITMDRVFSLSLAGSAVLGGVLSATADSFSGQMEGIAIGIAASSLACFASFFAHAIQGDHSKAAKRLVAAGALAALSYGVSEIGNADRFRLVEEKDCAPGLILPKDAIRKIQNHPDLLTHFYFREYPDHEGIKWISKGPTKVFSLTDGASDIVFKIGYNSESTCNNMMKVGGIVSHHDSSVLYVPPAKKLTFETRRGLKVSMIAQEKLSVDADAYVQENLYRENAGRLNDVISQLVKVISESGWSDVTPRNVPLRATADSVRPLQAVLHDLDEMRGAEMGIIGNDGFRDGLVGCLFGDDIDFAIEKARNNGVLLWDARKAKERRLNKIRYDNELRAYHEEHEISQGNEPLVVDIEQLGLDLDAEVSFTRVTSEGEEEVTVTMRQLTELVVNEINDSIARSSATNVRWKRRVDLGPSLGKYSGAGSWKDSRWVGWFGQIAAALKQNGHIFFADHLGMNIQA